MVGIIHLILFDLIRDVSNEDTLQNILKAASIDANKQFKLNEVYDDEEWQRLFDTTLKVLNISPEQAYIAYAKKFLEVSLKKFPAFFQMSKNSYEFLCRQPVIHNGFAKGVTSKKERNNINDKFTIEKSHRKIITHYRSSNKLCGLYKALAKEVIHRYDDIAEIVEQCCQHKGDPECEIHIVWEKLSHC